MAEKGIKGIQIVILPVKLALIHFYLELNKLFFQVTCELVTMHEESR